MSKRSSITTRTLRSRVRQSSGNSNDSTQPTIPTILRRKRNPDEIGLYESSPVSSKESRPSSRKRKCPMPKSDRLNDDDDEIEIITLPDSSEDDSSRENNENKCLVTASVNKALVPIGKSNTYRTRSKAKTLNMQFRSLSIGFPTPTSSFISRLSPLPNFSWADPREVWELMLHKDEVYNRNPLLLHRHPSLQARMRAILLDWLSEVCEVYRLHRETYYLALDFIDRYLSSQSDIPKQQLQLLGITCLFIAAKIEEIYPPKLSEFAYVTDGACVENDIINKELVILKALNWDLCPMTVNSWLSVYMQLFASFEKENAVNHDGERFMIPEYSSSFFAQIAHLIDLCMLDIGSLSYNYSVIAATALYHFTCENTVYQCTGKCLF